MNNEQIIRRAYELAEKVDVKGWVACLTSDGTFTDMSIGVTHRGPDGPTGLGKTVEVYAKAFPDMHRELNRFSASAMSSSLSSPSKVRTKGPCRHQWGFFHQRASR